METLKNNEVADIAILGGGVSGIISVKWAIEYGFKPVLFEEQDTLGGNWRKNNKKTWDSLITNLSKNFTGFSDFMFDNYINQFPSKTDMCNFVNSYIELFNIKDYCVFKSKVIYVKTINIENLNIFKIYYLENYVKKNITVKYVLSCTGNYHKPYYSNLKKFILAYNSLVNATNYTEIIHSSNYSSNYDFKNKNVVVVGCSHSGAEITSSICTSANKVYNIFKKSFWFIPKFVYDKNYDKYIPYDISLMSKNYINYKKEIILNYLNNTNTKNKIINENLNSSYKINNIILNNLSNQNNSLNNTIHNNMDDKNISITISQDYLNYTNKNYITPIIGNITDINILEKKVKILVKEKNSDKFEEKILNNIDIIILCTGYQRDFTIYDNSILKDININSNNNKRFIAKNIKLKYMMLSPSYNISFISTNPGFFFTWELQVRTSLLYFKDLLNKKWKIFFDKFDPYFNSVKKEIIVYVEFLSYLINTNPELIKIKKLNKQLYYYIKEGPFMYSHYCVNDIFNYSNKSKEYLLSKKHIENIINFNKDLNNNNKLPKY